MSAGVTVNSASLDRKLAQLALLGGKGMEEALRDGAKRFASTAIRNTMPMMLSSTPAAAKKEWEGRVSLHFETKRLTKKGYRKDAEVRRLLAAKKKTLGREASGWNAAAQALSATRVPAWVRRHGTGEGGCRITRKGDRLTIIVTNSVPYNEGMTARRAAFALAKVERGFKGNLRHIKRKLLRSVK